MICDEFLYQHHLGIDHRRAKTPIAAAKKPPPIWTATMSAPALLVDAAVAVAGAPEDAKGVVVVTTPEVAVGPAAMLVWHQKMTLSR